MLKLWTLTLSLGWATAGPTIVSCIADPACAVYDGRSALDAMLQALDIPKTAFPNMRYTSNQTVAAFWDYEGFHNQTYISSHNTSDADPASNQTYISSTGNGDPARIWQAEFDQGASGTIQDARVALQAMIDAKCQGCAAVSLDKTRSFDDPSTPRFVVRGMDTQTQGISYYPKGYPSSCDIAKNISSPYFGWFCPTNATVGSCPKLIGNDCQIGKYVWKMPQIGPSVPQVETGLQTHLRRATIDMTQKNHDISSAVPVTKHIDPDPMFNISFISSWPGVSTSDGLWAMQLLEPIPLAQVQTGLEYAFSAAQTLTSCWMAGNITNTKGVMVGAFNITTIYHYACNPHQNYNIVP